jgi:hypothetical protein
MFTGNKVTVHRGVDMPNKRPSALTMEWESKKALVGGSYISEMSNGTLAVLAFDATAGKMVMKKVLVANYAAQANLDADREFLYITYQGSEEPKSNYFDISDSFVKLRDCFMTVQLSSAISDADWAAVQAEVLDPSLGSKPLGLSLGVDHADGSLTTEPFTPNGGAAIFAGHYVITGTRIVEARTEDGAKLVTFVC